MYDVELTASNGFGSNSFLVPTYINVGAGAAVPLVETFQAPLFPPVNWEVENGDGAITWINAGPVTGIAGTPTLASYMNNFAYNAAGQEDGLITERVNLAGSLSPIVTFDISHARYSAAFEDALRIDVSTDCGVTYIPSGYFKQGTVLATVPDQTGLFTPNNANQWRTDTLDLIGYVGSEVSLKFVNITGYGNSLYIDNINFKESFVGLNENNELTTSVDIFPNPGKGVYTVNVNSPFNETAKIKVLDLKGSEIRNTQVILNGGLNTYTVDISTFEKGIYMLEITSENVNHTVKLVVL